MLSNPFDLFIQLVKLDQKLYENQRKKELHQNEVAELYKQLDDARSTLGQAELVYHNLQKKIHSLELDLKVIDQQLLKTQFRLDNASNQKEYHSAAGEVTLLNAKRLQIDDELLNLYNEKDIAQEDLQKRSKEFEAFKDNIVKFISDKEELVKLASQEIEKLQQERPANLQGFPNEWLEKYNTMRKTVANPVVPVVSDSCGGCFYAVSPVDMNALKHNKLVACKECYRLLYIKE